MRDRNRRWTRVQSEILVWCGDEPLELAYDAQTLWVPPVDKIAKVGIGSPYRLPAATTKAGVPLPGTVVIEDVIVDTAEGGAKVAFSVRDFCGFLERDMPELFDRGFDIVSDPDDVRPAQIEGRPLYEASLDARAKEIIDQELARRKQLEDSGRPLTAASNEKDVVWAFRHRQKRGAARPSVSTEDLFAAASGGYVKGPEAPAVAPTGKTLVAECESLGIVLTKAELLGLLRDDAEQTSIVMDKIAARHRTAAAANAEVESPA